MKPSPKMQAVITALATKYHFNLNQQEAYLRLTMPHYEPLVIEVLHENLVNVAHVYEHHPKLRLADPAVAFFTGYDLWVPVEINLCIGGYRVYAALSEDMSDITAVLFPQQADLAGFAELWAANIEGQGWLQDATVQEESIAF